MKRALSSLLVFALVLTLLVPAFAFAADKTTEQKFNELKEKGLLNGVEDGSAALDRELTRAELAAILVRLFKLEPITGQSSFIDVPENHWAQKEGVIEAVAKAGLMGSTSTYSKTFSPDAKLTIAEVATVTVRALKLTVDENAKIDGVQPWAAPYVDAALKAQVIKEAKDYHANANRGILVDAAYVIYNTILVPPVTELKVEKVYSDNLKTIKVQFNNALNADTVNTNTVKVTNTTLEDVLLSEDGKEVIIVLAAAKQQSSTVEVKVNGVKDVNGSAVSNFAQNLVLTDLAVPQLTGVKALNAKQIELQFTEPVQLNNPAYIVHSNIKLDGSSLVAKATQNYVNNTVVLQTTTPIKAGTHKLEVSGVSDYANLKTVKGEYEFTVAEDTAAPVLESAKAISLNVIEVTFNEAVDLRADGSYGTFKVNGNTIPRSNVTPVAKSNGTKFQLGLNTELDLAATVQVVIAYKGQRDMAGNEVKDEVTYTFKVTDDTTLPEVSLAVSATNKVTLTFSKPMLTDTGTITLYRGSSERTSFSVSSIAPSNWKSNYSVLELPASLLGLTSVNGGSYTLNIKGMKDATIRKNLLPEQNLAFTANDTQAPTVMSGYTVSSGDTPDEDTITFYFSEAMDEDSLKNLSNYRVDATGVTFAYISGVSLKAIAADLKSVTFYYPNASSLTTQTFTIVGVKDLNGNMAALTTVSKASATGINVVSVEATAVNEVVVEFNKQISFVDPSAFRLTGPNGFGTYFVSATIDSNPRYIVFTTDRDLDGDAQKYQLVFNNLNGVKDAYGNVLDGTLNTVAANVADSIAPVFEDATKGEYNNTAVNNKVTLHFSEGISASFTNFVSELVVRDANGTRIASSNVSVESALNANGQNAITGTNLVKATEVVIRISPSAFSSNGNKSVTLSFPIVTNIVDEAGNKLLEDAVHTTTISVASAGVTATASQVTAGAAPTPVIEATKTGTSLADVTPDISTKDFGVSVNDANYIVNVSSIDGSQADGAAVAAALNTAIDTAIGSDNVDVTFDTDHFVFVTKNSPAFNVQPKLSFYGSAITDLGLDTVAATGTAGNAGTQQVNKLVVTTGASTDGSITVTFNDGSITSSKTISVTAGQNTATIATAIFNAFNGQLTGYTVTNPVNGEVHFTATTPAANKTITITVTNN
jgi:methionine-rich copper-binding protein CopC